MPPGLARLDGQALGPPGLTGSDVRDHPLDRLLVRLGNFGASSQARLTAGRLLRQDVRVERAPPTELSGSRLLEPFRGASVGFHFWHDVVFLNSLLPNHWIVG